MAPGRRSGNMGRSCRETGGAHHQQFPRSSAVYSGAGAADWIGIAAIPGQLADSSGVQRARSANEFGREGRPLSKTNQGDRASNLRVGCKAVPWLAPDALAVLPDPRGPREVAAAPADRNGRAAGP